MASFNTSIERSLAFDPEAWHALPFNGPELPITTVLFERRYLDRLRIDPSTVTIVSFDSSPDVYGRPRVQFEIAGTEQVREGVVDISRGLNTEGQDLLMLSQPPIIGAHRKPAGLIDLAFTVASPFLNKLLGTS